MILLPYCIGTLLGIIICFLIGQFVAGPSGISIFLFSYMLGIPIGGALGLSSIVMVNQFQFMNKVIYMMVAALYFFGGMIGVAVIFIAANTAYQFMQGAIGLEIGGILLFFVLPLGGLIGLLSISQLVRKMQLSVSN